MKSVSIRLFFKKKSFIILKRKFNRNLHGSSKYFSKSEGNKIFIETFSRRSKIKENIVKRKTNQEIRTQNTLGFCVASVQTKRFSGNIFSDLFLTLEEI